jgi:hypothetical protein
LVIRNRAIMVNNDNEDEGAALWRGKSKITLID